MTADPFGWALSFRVFFLKWRCLLAAPGDLWPPLVCSVQLYQPLVSSHQTPIHRSEINLGLATWGQRGQDTVCYCSSAPLCNLQPSECCAILSDKRRGPCTQETRSSSSAYIKEIIWRCDIPGAFESIINQRSSVRSLSGIPQRPVFWKLSSHEPTEFFCWCSQPTCYTTFH